MTAPDGHWLYRAFDSRERLLYVGRTIDRAGRLKAHQRSSAWWQHMVRHETEGPMTYEEIQVKERAAINSEAPLYNADAPHRYQAVRAIERLRCTVEMVALRDGWHPGDAGTIGGSIAAVFSHRCSVGSELTTYDADSVAGDAEVLIQDPIVAAWCAYARLVRSGWAPELTDTTRLRGILVERWDPYAMGDLPSLAYRLVSRSLTP